MTSPVDVQALAAQVTARLTGPDGPFEMVVEDVRGVPIQVMRHRRHSLGAVLADSVRFGTRDYLVTADRRMSFAEHADGVAALARALRERYGVGKGDRVGIFAANTPEWVMAFWAAQSLGAIAVGYNAWWTASEIAYGLGHTEPSVLMADAKRAAAIAELDSAIPVLTMERDVPELLAEFAGAQLEQTPVDEDDPAVILYTSGTSGRPKGVVHSHRNLLAVIDYHRFGDALAAAFGGASWDEAAPSDLRYLLTSPLFHIASLHNLVVPRLATGSTVVMHQGAFDIDRVLSLAATERVTNWGAVPAMAVRLLRADLSRYDLSALTGFALASAPSSVQLQEELRQRVPFARNALVDSYGLTESSTAVAVATPPELAAYPGTLGKPILGVDLQIRDSDGAVLSDGETGEIWVRSPYVMLGYWRDEAATAAAIDDQQWLRTGDVGTVSEGRVRLSGRRTDLILRGGENIYPTEIEQCLEQHPMVIEAVVIAIEDAEFGQLPGAVVVIEPGAGVTDDELREFVKRRLAYFKVPTRWRIDTTPLPRNATGKVARAQIPPFAV